MEAKAQTKKKFSGPEKKTAKKREKIIVWAHEKNIV